METMIGRGVACALGVALWMAGSALAATADHGKFKELQGPFASGEDVTRACLSCHTEAARQVMATRHWTWEYENPADGSKLGKKTMLNGFCIGDKSNEAFCQSCHVGYGWKDDSFDFSAEEKVDCLACHNTGGYKKLSGLAGHPAYERMEWPPGSGKFVEATDLARVAQHVGHTSRETCGTCHYYGGGGDGVKHGDLDSSLNAAPRELDVHMAQDGLNFACSDCHQAEEHKVPGSRIAMTAADPHGPLVRGQKSERNPATCQSCHGDKPHEESLLHAGRLNAHTDTLACQACHIPSFARGGVPTKMGWDWSTAGRMDQNGKPFQKKDDKGHVIYDSKKGDFVLGENVVPDYLWFNGKVTYTTIDTRIDPSAEVAINTFHGGPDDPDARIWPVKIFHGKQPYDVEHRTLLVPHTATPDDTAFWYNFDWPKALAAGAAATGQPYSGKFDFAATRMIWPITHMVAPKERAVACHECHSRDGRLAGVEGIYVPGRDGLPLLRTAGWLAALAALAGVLIHGALRILTHYRGK
ncbi:tetrathionate reductase family octaheme c-type cytochrome [Thauera butanivorans]|uniref:tetrathionate reductase family octaheme c-type cytochrome n=1 Tax=Thauera butanivorans TaxID=86174 RepID=UPI0009FC14CF|nr:tetrathionate reductase family octaheme c-type cytochrome [Thauera butanivorans]